jgi:hypothetical protein
VTEGIDKGPGLLASVMSQECWYLRTNGGALPSAKWTTRIPQNREGDAQCHRFTGSSIPMARL